MFSRSNRHAAEGMLRLQFSPLPPLLAHSSYTPSLDEASGLRDSIHDIKTTIESADDEIARLHAQLAALKVHRDSLHTSLRSRQAALSSIRRIPPEILSEIFLFAGAGCRMRWPRPQDELDVDDTPWVISRVCSFWRAVALSVPKLWSTLQLEFTSNFSEISDRTKDQHLDDLMGCYLIHTKKRYAAAKEFLEACLARSGKELLTFSISTREPIKRQSHDILRALVAHSTRWGDVSLDASLFPDYKEELAAVKHKLPRLRRVRIGAWAEYDAPPFTTQFDALEDAPALRELCLIHVRTPSAILSIPWSQITHLTSKGNNFQEGEFTEILQNATNLVSLSTANERILEVGTSLSTVHLPELTQLSITNKGSYIAKTFQLITAPKLQALSVRAITSFYAEQAIAMLARSQCRPTRLSFHASFDVDALWNESRDENMAIARLLSQMPSVEDLHLTVLRAADSFIARMLKAHVGGEATVILPNLKTFSLEDRHCLSAADLIESLCSRVMRTPGSPNRSDALPLPGDYPLIDSDKEPMGLRSIKLQLYRPLAPKFVALDGLKALAKTHGVDLTIQCG